MRACVRACARACARARVCMCGLTVSLFKTKLLVVNGSIDCDDLQPLITGGMAIEVVSEFRYLGAMVKSKGETMKDVEERIA